ncbi:MAG: enoyl-CoA hydratase/isomerase family protein [Elusimicrobia bacterium]|nr:enoyl-CoA hydratase/isomerase family protein [Elusimicrobiota bacterium]
MCTLNRPEALNALCEAAIAELLKHLKAFDKNPAIRAIVLTGGPKVFAAGADIKEMAGRSATQMKRQDMLAAWDGLAKISKPLVAAVNGFALGGGNELAMVCDLIVAGEDAVFGQPEILLGVMPGAGGTQRLVRAVGRARALELLWTGKRLSARQALEWGLVNAVVPAPLVLDEALRIAREIAAQPPLAVRAIKASVTAGLDTKLLKGLRQERRRFYALFDTQDQKEGMAAFMEKRRPRFTGI